MTCYNKALLIGKKVSFIVNKWQIFGHVRVNDFWLRKILQISAVPETIWRILNQQSL